MRGRAVNDRSSFLARICRIRELNMSILLPSPQPRSDILRKIYARQTQLHGSVALIPHDALDNRRIGLLILVLLDMAAYVAGCQRAGHVRQEQAASPAVLDNLGLRPFRDAIVRVLIRDDSGRACGVPGDAEACGVDGAVESACCGRRNEGDQGVGGRGGGRDEEDAVDAADTDRVTKGGEREARRKTFQIHAVELRICPEVLRASPCFGVFLQDVNNSTERVGGVEMAAGTAGGGGGLLQPLGLPRPSTSRLRPSATPHAPHGAAGALRPRPPPRTALYCDPAPGVSAYLCWGEGRGEEGRGREGGSHPAASSALSSPPRSRAAAASAPPSQRGGSRSRASAPR